jgi:hypothetical protein
MSERPQNIECLRVRVMKSFDLFGTLVVGRNPAIRDGDQDSHFPIAENVAKVRRGDLIISDFYHPEKAQRLLKEVAGLDNDLIVTEDGKATAKVWERLQACGQTPELHTGDDPITDYASPHNHGIRCELTALAKFSALEMQMAECGFPGLAQLMREARLSTWNADETLRSFQLFQAQVNLPFLFLASILVYRRILHLGCRRLLLSSRDCWLWFKLFSAFAEHHLPGAYDVIYFHTSRLTRYFPSENYERYVARLLAEPALVVDLCGFGTSLARLIGDRAETLLLVGYEGCPIPHLIHGWMNEVTNFARHPMIADVDESGNPIHTNPLGIDWTAIPELAVMHAAFLCGVSAVAQHDFSRDFACPDSQVDVGLRMIFSHFDDFNVALGTLTRFRVEEAQATAELINARGGQGIVVSPIRQSKFGIPTAETRPRTCTNILPSCGRTRAAISWKSACAAGCRRRHSFSALNRTVGICLAWTKHGNAANSLTIHCGRSFVAIAKIVLPFLFPPAPP